MMQVRGDATNVDADQGFAGHRQLRRHHFDGSGGS
jgi:hypothetical protein